MPGDAKSEASQGVISPGEVPGNDREDRGGEPDREGDSAGDPGDPRGDAAAKLEAGARGRGLVEAGARGRGLAEAGARGRGLAEGGASGRGLAEGSDGEGRPLEGLPSDASDGAASDDEAADRRELERAIAEHLPALKARAAQLCRGYGDADDIVQEALLRAFRARRQMREIARLRGWLLTILTNTFLDSLRRRKARPGEVELQFDLPAPTVDEDDSPWARIDLDAIRAAVAELPDDVRQTYEMFAFEGRDYTGISSALGVPKATVGTRILRARKRLRGLLMRAM